MAERFNAAVLKTVDGVTRPGVRIPVSPPKGFSLKKLKPFFLQLSLKSLFMKKLQVFSILIIFLINSSTVAQNIDDLDSRINEFTSLLLDPKESKFKEITSPKLTYGHSNSIIEDQKTFIDALVSGKSDYVKINVTDQKTDITGKTAIVRQILDLDVTNNGTTNHLNLKVILVWVKEKGKWILIARQAVRIPQQ